MTVENATEARLGTFPTLTNRRARAGTSSSVDVVCPVSVWYLKRTREGVVPGFATAIRVEKKDPVAPSAR